MLLLNLFFFLLYRSTLLDAARIKFSLPTGHHKKKPLKIRSVQPQINFNNYANTQFHGSTFWLVHSPCACAERYTLPAAFKLANISFILLRKMWRYPKIVFGLREGYFIIAHCECWKTRRSCTAYNIVEDCYQIETYMDRGSWTNFPAL